ncbi:signal peptidase I [Natrialba swarupiae]|uniref:Signal peptidase I n=1 Tax=Natrialba swarupiae TaxID=2448032 RepID=A0A5D5AS21_9EURY|nr:signal peptidase I [Natrialba swarupiae]TYT63833.1 signal peptidase I [Natrialba swarupiae]
MNYRKTANVLGLLVLIAIVVPFVIYAVPGVIGAEYSFVVLTGSMAPAIDPGDVVIVGETEPTTIESGDVITFVRDGADTPVTHRVVGVADAGGELAFETKGDANSEVDAGVVPAGNVLGVVVLTIPYLGYVIQMTNSTAGFLLLVVVPIVLFVASELWALFQSARRGGGETRSATDSDAADGVPLESEAVADDERALDSSDAATTSDGTPTGPAEGNDAITLSASDLVLSSAILALTVPYVAYVAFELRTALSISVAVAAALSLLAVGGLWLSARRGAPTPRPQAEIDSSDDLDGVDSSRRDGDVLAAGGPPGGEETFEAFVPATEGIDAATDGGDGAEVGR